MLSLRHIVINVATLVGVAIIYLAMAKVGLAMAIANGTASPVWPAAGVAIAALTLLGPGWFPAITLAAFWANTSAGASSAVAAGDRHRRDAGSNPGRAGTAPNERNRRGDPRP